MHFGAAAFERLQVDAAQVIAVDGRFGPSFKLFDCGVWPGHHQSVVHSAGRLNQGGRGQVRQRQHHPWRKAHKARSPVRLDHHHTIDQKISVAQTDAVAHTNIQGHQQGSIDPNRTRGWNVGCRFIGRAVIRGNAQGAAQGITWRHSLEGHQTGIATLGLIGQSHGGKAHMLRPLKAQLLCLRHKTGWQGLIAAHHSVATQQLARITLQTILQPVGKETHRGQSRHRKGNGQHQQAQFASAPIAPQRAPSQSPKGGGCGGLHTRMLTVQRHLNRGDHTNPQTGLGCRPLSDVC